MVTNLTYLTVHYSEEVHNTLCSLFLREVDGFQDILSLSIVENESASGWMAILDDLKSRGAQDILFLSSDNLSGITRAGEAVFTQSIHQICIVHQIRNSLRYVNWKDRRAIIKDIKAIYQSSNGQAAKDALEIFKNNWNDNYPLAGNHPSNYIV